MTIKLVVLVLAMVISLESFITDDLAEVNEAAPAKSDWRVRHLCRVARLVIDNAFWVLDAVVSCNARGRELRAPVRIAD